MRGRFIWALAGLSAMSAETSTLGQAPAPAATPRTVWALDFQNSQCAITTGNIDSLGFSFRMTPGEPEPTIYVVGRSRALSGLNGKIGIEFGPNGQHFDAEVGQGMLGKARVLESIGLDHRVPAAFAGSNEITLVRGQTRLTIPIKGASKAFGALQQCIDAKLLEWGIDPKPLAALRTPPTDIEGRIWISGLDYPVDAMQAEWSGHVVVRLNVDATGDVTDCAVVVSSGWKSVDGVTCRKAKSQAKFHPAIGADGRPISAIRTGNIKFRLES